MSELHIPKKLRDIVNIVSEPMFDEAGNRIVAQYNGDTDTFDIDPLVTDKAVLCEEFWHRKQVLIKRELGLPVYEGRKSWIGASADELGIAPRTRDVAKRFGLDTELHDKRYLWLLRVFTATCLKDYKEESLDYFQSLKGKRLFDGLAFIIDYCYDPEFHPYFLGVLSQEYERRPEALNSFWKRINEARKSW